jgi:hypothetical protein
MMARRSVRAGFALFHSGRGADLKRGKSGSDSVEAAG